MLKPLMLLMLLMPMIRRMELLTTLRLRPKMRMATLRFKIKPRNSQSVMRLKKSSPTLSQT